MTAVGPHNVFVYGSLMAEEVAHMLLTRLPPSSPALLPNFELLIVKWSPAGFNIKGCVYPAILPAENSTLAGKVLIGLNDAELEILDRFEDKRYIRKSVNIFLPGRSEKLLTEVYVWRNKDDPDLRGEWDFEEWKKLHLNDYLATTKAFIERIGGP